MMLETQKASNLSNGHRATMLSSSMTQSKEAHSDQRDGNAITRQTYAGCLLSEAIHYQPALSIHTASMDHPSSTLVSPCHSYAAQTRNGELQESSHLVRVSKAPADKKFERKVLDSWRQARQNSTAASPQPISPGQVLSVLKCVKLGTAPGYDNIHPEFLKHLGPLATTWLSTFFSRVVMEQRIPRTWRQAKVVALQKPMSLRTTVQYHF